LRKGTSSSACFRRSRYFNGESRVSSCVCGVQDEFVHKRREF
jgi:hypothetical protein